MKKSVLTFGLAILAMLPFSSQAVSLEQALTFDITVFTQGATTTNHGQEIKHVGHMQVGNREVIAALSTAVMHDLTGGHLLLVRPNFGSTNSSGGNSRIIVRKGTNDTDVTSYFNPQNTARVESSVFQVARDSFLSFTKIEYFTLTFNASNLSFSLGGVSTETGHTISKGTGANAVSGEAGVFRANVAGTVTDGDSTGPAQGTLSTAPGVLK